MNSHNTRKFYSGFSSQRLVYASPTDQVETQAASPEYKDTNVFGPDGRMLRPWPLSMLKPSGDAIAGMAKMMSSSETIPAKDIEVSTPKFLNIRQYPRQEKKPFGQPKTLSPAESRYLDSVETTYKIKVSQELRDLWANNIILNPIGGKELTLYDFGNAVIFDEKLPAIYKMKFEKTPETMPERLDTKGKDLFIFGGDNAGNIATELSKKFPKNKISTEKCLNFEEMLNSAEKMGKEKPDQLKGATAALMLDPEAFLDKKVGATEYDKMAETLDKLCALLKKLGMTITIATTPPIGGYQKGDRWGNINDHIRELCLAGKIQSVIPLDIAMQFYKDTRKLHPEYSQDGTAKLSANGVEYASRAFAAGVNRANSDIPESERNKIPDKAVEVQNIDLDKIQISKDQWPTVKLIAYEYYNARFDIKSVNNHILLPSLSYAKHLGVDQKLLDALQYPESVIKIFFRYADEQITAMEKLNKRPEPTQTIPMIDFINKDIENIIHNFDIMKVDMSSYKDKQHDFQKRLLAIDRKYPLEEKDKN